MKLDGYVASPNSVRVATTKKGIQTIFIPTLFGVSGYRLPPGDELAREYRMTAPDLSPNPASGEFEATGETATREEFNAAWGVLTRLPAALVP